MNTTTPDLKLADGSFSAALLKEAGTRLQDECSLKFPKGIKTGEIARTKGYQLKCKEIFHTTLSVGFGPEVQKAS